MKIRQAVGEFFHARWNTTTNNNSHAQDTIIFQLSEYLSGICPLLIVLSLDVLIVSAATVRQPAIDTAFWRNVSACEKLNSLLPSVNTAYLLATVISSLSNYLIVQSEEFVQHNIRCVQSAIFGELKKICAATCANQLSVFLKWPVWVTLCVHLLDKRQKYCIRSF